MFIDNPGRAWYLGLSWRAVSYDCSSVVKYLDTADQRLCVRKGPILVPVSASGEELSDTCPFMLYKEALASQQL